MNSCYLGTEAEQHRRSKTYNDVTVPVVFDCLVPPQHIHAHTTHNYSSTKQPVCPAGVNSSWMYSAARFCVLTCSCERISSSFPRVTKPLILTENFVSLEKKWWLKTVQSMITVDCVHTGSPGHIPYYIPKQIVNNVLTFSGVNVFRFKLGSSQNLTHVQHYCSFDFAEDVIQLDTFLL